MVLKKMEPEKLRNLVGKSQELSDLFGLLPGSLEFNEYPAFNKNDLKDVLDGIKLAKQKVQDSIKKDNLLLAKYGVPSIMALLEGVIVQGEDANTFDGRKSYKLIWNYAKSGKESDNLTRTTKQYFVDNKESVGAIVNFN